MINAMIEVKHGNNYFIIYNPDIITECVTLNIEHTNQREFRNTRINHGVIMCWKLCCHQHQWSHHQTKLCISQYSCCRVFYALTGCDTVSSLFYIGKITFFNNLRPLSETLTLAHKLKLLIIQWKSSPLCIDRKKW